MEHIVETTLGKVRGYERDGMIEYLGIPYAKPPVGPLRFKRSVLHDVWNEVFDAKEYGPAPIQYNNGTVIGDEDCLTVNVQRPCEGEHLPVMSSASMISRPIRGVRTLIPTADCPTRSWP